MNQIPDNRSVRSADEFIRHWFTESSNSSSASDSLGQGLSHLWQVVRDNRWLIVFVTLLAAVLGVVKAVSEKPVYQARLTMAVEPSNYRNSSQAVFDPYAFRFYETQYELLKSRSVAERVVNRLSLAERDSVQQMLVPPSLLESVLREINKLTGFSDSKPENTAEPSAPMSEQQLLERKTWLTAIIQNGVNVSGGEKTHLVEVTFRATNPEFAAEVANALVDAYIEQGFDSQLNRTQQTSEWLSERLVELKKTLDIAQQNLQEFLVREDMLDSTRSEQIKTSELQTLNQEYLEARAKLDDLAKRYGARHPQISAARAEVAAAKSRLDNRSRSISASRAKEIELSSLERDVQVSKELYEAFLAKFKEADLSNTGSQVASARIVDNALAPSAPIYPQKQRIVFSWAIGGLLLGVALAFVREQLDSTFRGGRQIEEKLGLPLFGIMQTMRDSSGGVERLYLENKRSVFSESVNHIRTGVTYSNVDNPPKVILITSSVQSEGKTTVASNLALSYAQLGPTLLIDADLRRPRIKHIINTDHNFGLVDLVAGVVSFKECVTADKQEPNLTILNSGTAPPNPLELLASDRFSNNLRALRDKFSYIIIDTAPVLPASDAIVLGQLCDALLMVVQSDRTTHHMARDAIKRLNASRVAVDGLVLTQADIKNNRTYRYGGYYGYGAYAYTEDSEHGKP